MLQFQCRALSRRLFSTLPSYHMNPLTATSTNAVRSYDLAVSSYLCLTGDPLKNLSEAISSDPTLVAAHALKAAFILLSTGHSGGHREVLASRAAGCEAVRKGAATPREVALVLAVEAWSSGRWHLATRILEHQLALNPLDVIVMRLLHDTYFFLGESASLRDSVARAFQAWDPAMPAHGYVCGMLAFGLEECGLYEKAEELAMGALNKDPRDVWALHAGVHVCEMRGQFEEGKRLLRETEEDWKESNIFARHLYWHWGIFSLEEGVSGYRSALLRLDNEVIPENNRAVLALVDATSLLWRLELLEDGSLHPPLPATDLGCGHRPGVGGGSSSTSSSTTTTSTTTTSSSSSKGGGMSTRWESLVSQWQDFLPPLDYATTPPTPWWPTSGVRAPTPRLGRWNAFNDVHAVMALSQGVAGAKRRMKAGGAGGGEGLALAAAAAGMEAALDALLHSMATTAESVKGWGGGGGVGEAHHASEAQDVAFLSATTAALGIPRPPCVSALVSTTPSVKSAGGSRDPPSTRTHPPDQARYTATVGLDTALGMAAFSRGDWAGAVAHLSAAQPHWHLLGGSHVQRDVFESTLLDALAASGRALCNSSSNVGVGAVGAAAGAGVVAAAAAAGSKGEYTLAQARALASKRVTLKPNSPQRWWSLGAVLGADGNKAHAAGAVGAKNRAHALGLNQGPSY